MFSFNDVDCLIILLPCFYNRWCFAPFAFFASLYWSNSRTTRGKTNSSHASISSHTNKLVPAYFFFQEVHCVANEHLFFSFINMWLHCYQTRQHVRLNSSLCPHFVCVFCKTRYESSLNSFISFLPAYFIQKKNALPRTCPRSSFQSRLLTTEETLNVCKWIYNN